MKRSNKNDENYSWADQLLYDRSKYIIDGINSYNNGDIVIVKKNGYKDGTSGINKVFIVLGDLNKLIPFEYALMLLSSSVSISKFKIYFRIPMVYRNNIVKNNVLRKNVLRNIDDGIACKIGEIDNFKMMQIKEKYDLLMDSKTVINNNDIFLK